MCEGKPPADGPLDGCRYRKAKRISLAYDEERPRRLGRARRKALARHVETRAMRKRRRQARRPRPPTRCGRRGFQHSLSVGTFWPAHATRNGFCRAETHTAARCTPVEAMPLP